MQTRFIAGRSVKRVQRILDLPSPDVASNTLNLPVKNKGRQRVFNRKTINHLRRKLVVNEFLAAARKKFQVF
jgi:hypothetical protein